MVEFATPETIKQPLGRGLIPSVLKPEDHIMGAGVFTGPEWTILQPDGQWNAFEPQAELQRDAYGDTYACVSFSCNNVHEFLHNKLYGVALNKSDRFLAIGSGTVRGQGNSKSTVAEWNRTNGFVLEQFCPYDSNTTLDQFYSPINQDLKAQGFLALNTYLFGYKWLQDNSPANLKLGLTYSPVQVDVEGQYAFNAKGYVINGGGAYCHEVMIFGYEDGVCWYLFDSESLQWLKFDWGFKFGSPMIHSLTRKPMPILYKQNSSPAIYALDEEKKTLVAFADGAINGSELFKTLYGVSNFSQLKIIHVDVLPYQIAPYQFKTI